MKLIDRFCWPVQRMLELHVEPAKQADSIKPSVERSATLGLGGIEECSSP
jgi:hypothetical protein